MKLNLQDYPSIYINDHIGYRIYFTRSIDGCNLTQSLYAYTSSTVKLWVSLGVSEHGVSLIGNLDREHDD